MNKGEYAIEIPLFLDRNKHQIDKYIEIFIDRIAHLDIDKQVVKLLAKSCFYLIYHQSRQTPEQLEMVFEYADFDSEMREEIINMTKTAAAQLIERGIEKGRQEGLNEGIQKGLNEGRQEGLNEGRQEGRQEGLNEGKAQLIQQMLKNGASVESIAQWTQMSIEEIKKFQQK